MPDLVRFIEVRGKGSGPVQPNDIELRANGEIVMDLVPDQYTIDVEVDGFVSTRASLDVGFDPIAKLFPIQNLVTLMPKVSELNAEQKRLLKTLDATKTPGEIWDALSDNKAATFFQVSHALSQVDSDGQPLSSLIERVVRVGGSQLTAPDTSGTSRTVIGWRMHVLFFGEPAVEATLLGAGMKQDDQPAHPTHKRFGYVRSFREKGANPRLQIVTDHECKGADVDLDNGAFHRSSPHEVFKSFPKRVPEGTKIYKVR